MKRPIPSAFLLLLLMASCVACGKKEAVNADQLQQVILADKRATVPICTRVTVPPVDKLPVKFELSAEKDTFGFGLHPRRRTGGQVISGLDDTGPQTQPGAHTPDWSAAAFRCTA